MDSLQLSTYIAVGISFSIYIGIAIWSSARSTKDFYAAGGNIPAFANGMATAADWMSAASFISLAGIIGLFGYGGSVYLMGWTGGYVLLATLLAPYLRKFGKFTVPEFIGDRFYSSTARTVAVICLLVASITYIIGQMTGVGIAFSRFLNVSNDTGIYIGMGIVFMYTVFGGMKGITYTQIAQYVILICAYTIPAIFISMQLTDVAAPQLGLGANLAGTETPLLTRLDQVLVDLGFKAYTTSLNGSTLNMAFLCIALMFGTAGLPHVIMRFFTVPTVRDARYSAGWALVFIAILFTTAPAVAAMAKFNLHATVNKAISTNGELIASDSNILYEERPDWMKRWEKTGLVVFEDKNGDGRIQFYNDKTTDEGILAKAESAGWKGNELTVKPDVMTLANPEIAKLPNWVIALVAAGGLAAALSTAAGLLLAISSAISHDLVKGVFNPNISDKGELMVGRIAMGASIVFAGWLGLNPPGIVAGTVALAFGIAASSLFPAIVMGIFFKSVNKEGAIAGMLTGLAVTLFYVFAHKGIMFVKGTEYLDLVGGKNGWFGLTPEAIGTVGAMVNFAVANLVSRMTKPTPNEIQDLVEAIRIPKKAEA